MSKLPASMTKRQRSTKAERGVNLYETHPVATSALLKHERLPYTLWENSCGRGAMARILRAAGHEVLSTDLIDYDSPDQDAAGFDFLEQVDMPMLGIDAIVMNPPFDLAALFVKKAIDLCPLVYALLPLRFLECGNEKTAAGRARLFVLDTEHLMRVRVFKNRLPFMHRDGWQGPKSTSTAAYGWYVFSWFHKGPALIDRISWELAPDEAQAVALDTEVGVSRKRVGSVGVRSAEP